MDSWRWDYSKSRLPLPTVVNTFPIFSSRDFIFKSFKKIFKSFICLEFSLVFDERQKSNLSFARHAHHGRHRPGSQSALR